MKNFTLIFTVIATLAFSSCGKGEIIISENDLSDGVFYLGNKLKPYTGKCVIYFNNTETIKEILNYKKGVLDGERISYYNNGSIKIQGEYKQGLYHGTWNSYSISGELLYSAKYRNDSIQNLHADKESVQQNSEYICDSKKKLLAQLSK